MNEIIIITDIIFIIFESGIFIELTFLSLNCNKGEKHIINATYKYTKGKKLKSLNSFAKGELNKGIANKERHA
jgi:hypothetical protein